MMIFHLQTQTPSRKPWIRDIVSNPSTNNANVDRSLRTPSLMRNLSQPTNNPKTNNIPLNRTQSSPASKSNPMTSGKTSPDAKVIPPLLSLSVAPPVGQVILRKPSMSIDRRRQSDTRSSDVVYSQVVSPAANVKKPIAPTAEIKATEHITKLKKYVHDKNLGEIEFKTIEMVTESTKQYVSSISVS